MTVDRLAIYSTPRTGRLPPKSETRGSTLRRDCSMSTQSLALQSRARRLVSLHVVHSELLLCFLLTILYLSVSCYSIGQIIKSPTSVCPLSCGRSSQSVLMKLCTVVQNSKSKMQFVRDPTTSSTISPNFHS